MLASWVAAGAAPRPEHRWLNSSRVPTDQYADSANADWLAGDEAM